MRPFHQIPYQKKHHMTRMVLSHHHPTIEKEKQAPHHRHVPLQKSQKIRDNGVDLKDGVTGGG